MQHRICSRIPHSTGSAARTRPSGVWITELDPTEEGPRAERIIDAERLSVAQIVAVDRRLERARDQEQSGAERMDTGTLVFRAEGGAAVGLLLPAQFEATRLTGVEDDLRRLLDGMRRKPQIVALAQAQSQEASLESVGSVGLRLAYQLERTLDAQVVVAALDTSGVRVIGVSGRGDRRLLDSLAPSRKRARPGCPGQSRAVTSRAATRWVEWSPTGGIVRDRFSFFPMVRDGKPVGAVAIWLSSGQEPTGSVRAELMEALDNAAPQDRPGAAKPTSTSVQPRSIL